ncbi:uncharacterized protein MYCFIDRAFT_84656 [Pseudocercospora fijiensis CIRAD86]|uniref:Uncharacterized protein n=1 Tax=Pseudocercospora fijiensis (strain CIRAD86) TaxID=383855 RepID=M2ZNG2_PSEFD|nr:uncharacterized protein MYCFIDRAFT_84656 [Pseudocercospora fijiensis CIRAD86]EME80634.1 hypothetical protein MYCFIDRAFT_84656 [Pseudocercospora fijiensis CIRAD86]
MPRSLKRGRDMTGADANEPKSHRPKKIQRKVSAESFKKHAKSIMPDREESKKQQNSEGQAEPEEDESIWKEMEKAMNEAAPGVEFPDSNANAAKHTTIVDEELADADNPILPANLHEKIRISTHPLRPGDAEYDFDQLALALRNTGNPLGATQLTRLNASARLEDARKEHAPRNEICRDFVAALRSSEGPNWPETSGARRVRRVQIFVEDFDAKGEELGEARKGYVYVATIKERF